MSIKVSNISTHVQPDHLHRLFSHFGPIQNLQHTSASEVLIEFANPSSSIPPALQLNGTQLADLPLQITQATDSNTIYIGNLSSQLVNEQVLGQFFQQHLGVLPSFVKMAGDSSQPTRFAFIEFQTPEIAQRAMSLDGTVCGGRPVKINTSRNGITRPTLIGQAPTLAAIASLPGNIQKQALTPSRGIDWPLLGNTTEQLDHKIMELKQRMEQKYSFSPSPGRK